MISAKYEHLFLLQTGEENTHKSNNAEADFLQLINSFQINPSYCDANNLIEIPFKCVCFFG